VASLVALSLRPMLSPGQDGRIGAADPSRQPEPVPR
jgi:hypothetical protein